MCLQFNTASVTTMFTAIHPCNIVASLCVTVIIFIQNTLSKHCLCYVCIKTLISGVISFTDNGLCVVTQFTTVDWRESLRSHFPLLCYTANKCGAVNMQILYPYPIIWPLFFSHCVPVNFVTGAVWDFSVLDSCFRTKDANKVAAHRSVCHHEKYYV